MRLIRRSSATTTTPDRTRRRPAAVVRGGALLGLAGLLGVGMAVGDRFTAEPAHLSDGSAWVGDGDDLVRGSSITGRADALVEGVLAGGGARIAQDGLDAVIVVNGEAFAMNSATLEPTNRRRVQERTVPLTRGGQAYLVEPGLVTCVDPQTLSDVAGSIPTPASASAPAPGVVDAQGRLWLAMRRTGEIWRVVDCEVDRRAASFPEGHDVTLTLAGGTPVLHDRTDNVVAWIDARTGELLGRAEVPAGSVIQGPSVSGDQVWLSGPGSTLLGVSRDGSIDTLDLSIKDPRRPEVIEGHVVVPSEHGQVAVVQAAPGERPEEVAVKDLEAAAAEDFESFVQDGEAWFTSPGSQSSGTITTEGEIRELIVEKEKLEKEQAEVPEDVAEVVPPSPAPAPSRPNRPSTPNPQSIPTPTRTEPTIPSGGGQAPVTTPTMVPSSTTTTTAPPPQMVTVADVRGVSPQAACERLVADGLRCTSTVLAGPGAVPDAVVDQTPAPGATVTAGDPAVVTYYATTTIPDLTGLDAAAACELLAQSTLGCEAIPADPGAELVKPGTAFGQPALGTEVDAHATITFNVDNTPYVPLWSCRVAAVSDDLSDPENYRTTVGTTPCPAGWQVIEAGVLAQVQGVSGRVPLTLHRIRASVLADPDSGQRSDRLSTPGDGFVADPAVFDPPVVIGYVWTGDVGARNEGLGPVIEAFGTGTGRGPDGQALEAEGNRGNFLYLPDGYNDGDLNSRPYSGVNILDPRIWTWLTNR